MSMCILFSWRVGISCVCDSEAWAHGRPTELFWMDWILGIRYYIEGSKRIIAQMYPKYIIKVNNIFHCFIRLKKEKKKESNDDGAKDEFLFKMIWDGNLLFNISVWFGYLIFPMVSSTGNLFLFLEIIPPFLLLPNRWQDFFHIFKHSIILGYI